jgi:hypothetical protein
MKNILHFLLFCIVILMILAVIQCMHDLEVSETGCMD